MRWTLTGYLLAAWGGRDTRDMAWAYVQEARRRWLLGIPAPCQSKEPGCHHCGVPVPVGYNCCVPCVDERGP